MLNEGGCGRLWPGIGNISYVKDLQTEEIVTTKFRCSQFSSHHSKSDGFVPVKVSHTVPVKVSHSLLLMVIAIMASCRLL
jgi:hypothetical protein